MTSPTGAPILVTGGAGFIGSNLVDRLAREGHRVVVFDTMSRAGVERNADWLRERHAGRVEILTQDVRDAGAVAAAVADAQAVFHFAAQVAVTTSLTDPAADYAINLQGTFNVLEALRKRGGRTPLIFASTNKVYGDLADIPLALHEGAYQPVDADLRGRGIPEERSLDFHTPYGCSKGAADQYVLDYARHYELPTAVMRMSCVYGPRQQGTEDQGWVAHFLISALQGRPITIFGDGRQVRDILFVDDAIEAYVLAWKALEQNREDVRGCAFNLGGGPTNAVSLLQLIDRIEDLIGRKVDLRFEPWRAGDQRYFVADGRRAAQRLALPAPAPWRSGLARLRQWLETQASPVASPVARAQQADA
jgi:CDP-paratose 2-epimerase